MIPTPAAGRLSGRALLFPILLISKMWDDFEEDTFLTNVDAEDDSVTLPPI